uniref:Uncharacterized protein n=1 Tax=Parascaris equorum TaxID=6256 RepID=A0A914R6L0_PAREQ
MKEYVESGAAATAASSSSGPSKKSKTASPSKSFTKAKSKEYVSDDESDSSDDNKPLKKPDKKKENKNEVIFYMLIFTTESFEISSRCEEIHLNNIVYSGKSGRCDQWDVGCICIAEFIPSRS